MATVSPPLPSPPTRKGRFDPLYSVSRVFQVLVVIYVLLTGELPPALQAALFGLAGGGTTEFTIALLLALLVDFARVAPLIVLARHPLGVLHPLIIVIVLWPLLSSMPTDIEQFGGLSGLFLGEPLSTPQYQGLGWQPPPEVWAAVAKYNALNLVSLLAVYAGFAFRAVKVKPSPAGESWIDPRALRVVLVALIAFSLLALFVLIQSRGGLEQHIAGMARGRFRSLAGLGPLVALVDLGSMCLVVWTAQHPRDVRSPLFLICLAAVTVGQFLSNGSRTSMFFMVMTVGLAWALRTRRIPWRVAVIAAPLAILALGLTGLIRSSGWQGQGAVESIQTTDTAQLFERVRAEVEDRRFIGAGVPVVTRSHEVTGLMMGETYLAAVFGMIPRAIWEEKPRGPGSIYAQRFLGVPREGQSIPVPAFAEAYWNFHLPGLIIIFALYGVLIRAVHELYITHAESAFVLAVFVTFASLFRMGTDDVVSFQQQMLMLGIVYVAARLFARKRRAAVGMSTGRLVGTPQRNAGKGPS